MPYPASSYPEGVDLTIIAGNQLHQVINGEANEVVSTTSGDIPSVRKALADSMMFKVPINWVQGEVTTDPLETRLYNGQPYWAPEATLANPVTLGTSPVATTDWLLAPQGYRNEYNLGKYQAGILISDSQEYVVYNGKSYFATNPPYTTTSITPDNDGSMFEGGYLTSQQLSIYTDIVYKASGGNSAVENMIANATIGESLICENGSRFKRISDSSGGIDDFKALGVLFAEDFGVAPSPIDSSNAFKAWSDKAFSDGCTQQINTRDLFFSDGVELDGGGSATNVIGQYNIKGNFNITLGDNATKTALSFSYVYFVKHDKIIVDGNKSNQTVTTISGINYWWVDTLVCESGTRADNCYQHGIHMFKLKNLTWAAGGGSNNGGVDGATVSSGIYAHAVGSGTIRDAICRSNNPSTTQPGEKDGNGIHLSQNASDDAFWNQSDFKKLTISGCNLVLNGRRGLKIQRANVVAFGNDSNNNNSANIFIGTSDLTTDNVHIYANEIGSTGDPTQNTISTDAAITNLHIHSNTFKGSPPGNAIDIASTVDGMRMHSNIEKWSGGFPDRYVIRSGAIDVEIHTDEQVNDASGGGVNRIYPSELAEITPGRISEPTAVIPVNPVNGVITIPSKYKNMAVAISVPTGTTEINTILGGYDGMVVSFRSLSSTGDSVIKSRIDNIYLNNNTDMSLTYPFDSLVLECKDFGGRLVWTEQTRADNF